MKGFGPALLAPQRRSKRERTFCALGWTFFVLTTLVNQRVQSLFHRFSRPSRIKSSGLPLLFERQISTVSSATEPRTSYFSDFTTLTISPPFSENPADTLVSNARRLSNETQSIGRNRSWRVSRAGDVGSAASGAGAGACADRGLDAVASETQSVRPTAQAVDQAVRGARKAQRSAELV